MRLVSIPGSCSRRVAGGAADGTGTSGVGDAVLVWGINLGNFSKPKPPCLGLFPLINTRPLENTRHHTPLKGDNSLHFGLHLAIWILLRGIVRD